jgi:hypothetical protein
MGWLFGRKKKKDVNKSLQDDKALSFNSASHDKNKLKPDQFKLAAGIDSGKITTELDSNSLKNNFGEMSEMGDNDSSLNTDVWGQLDVGTKNNKDNSKSIKQIGDNKFQSNKDGLDLPVSQRSGIRRMSADFKYIQVQQYKRILGELKDLNAELSHMSMLSKSLDKAEYNEEKHFMRLKETMRKVHDKTLLADRSLFSS